MKEIPLNGAVAAGRCALVDDSDYECVARYKWHAGASSSASGTLYAGSCSKIDGVWKTFRMHKLITGWPMTDHINHDGLDNRRSNLRPVTNSQNAANMQQRRSSSSRYKGVSWNQRYSRWRAFIRLNGKSVHLGYFDDEISAATAYAVAALSAWGSYANVDIPVQGVPGA